MHIKDIKQKVLNDRGLAPTQSKVRTKRVLTHRNVLIPRKAKSPLMKYLENKYGDGQTIWDILTSGSLNSIVKRLGNEVDRTTISKWQTRYKLRYNATNLPLCDDCSQWQTSCDAGLCTILIEKQEWELVLKKKEEILRIKA